MTNNNSINQTTFSCAALEFDLVLGSVRNALGETQRFSPINLKLLAYLVGHQGEVVSRTELFDAIWPNQIVSDDVLTRAISDIRAQLGKVDSSTKFIETLPKRGYRWVIAACPVEAEDISHSSSAVRSGVLPSSRTAGHQLMMALFYMIAALLLASVMMWVVSQSVVNQVGLAVLPTTYDRPQMMMAAASVNSDILDLLRKNSRIKLLSASAIASRPNNPFPYFFTEFGAKWVLESRVSDLEGVNRVELSLVDARTGLELRTFGFDAAANSSDFLIKLSRRLGDALADGIAY